MSRVEEIESAIAELPPDEFLALANWLRELENERWDRQMDADSVSGKLDALFSEVSQAGALEWPPVQ